MSLTKETGTPLSQIPSTNYASLQKISISIDHGVIPQKKSTGNWVDIGGQTNQIPLVNGLTWGKYMMESGIEKL